MITYTPVASPTWLWASIDAYPVTEEPAELVTTQVMFIGPVGVAGASKTTSEEEPPVVIVAP